MAKKLGYTWYPNDWRGSDRVFQLSLSERGLYREIIDMAYMEGNRISFNAEIWSRRLGCSVKEIKTIVSHLSSLVDVDEIPLIVVAGNVISVPSCEPRRRLSEKNKSNGQKGGRPKNENPEINPEANQNNNPNRNPELTQGERQREIERERENKTETERENSPPMVSLSPGELYLTAPISECVELYFSSKDFELAREQLAMNSKIDEHKLKRWAGVFALEQTEKGTLKKTISDFASHFRNWMKFRNPTENPENYGKQTNSAEHTEEKQLTEWEQTLARNREKYGKPR